MSPDRPTLDAFVGALFMHADEDTFISLRAFGEGTRDKPPIFISPTKVGDSHILDWVFNRAKQAAESDIRVNFCPPVCTFNNQDKADEASIANGVALSIECDTRPDTARRLLSAILGSPTVVCASGGEWIDPETGEVQPKMHLHWRLAEPTRDPAAHRRLKEARRLACAIVGADPTAVPLNHPLRWPGSVHRKGEPKMSLIVAKSDNEIDLDDALAKLQAAAPDDVAPAVKPYVGAGLGFGPDLTGDPLDIAAALAAIPNADLAWDQWNRIAMAAQAAGGTFATFDAWSAKSAKYDAAATLDRWNHIARHPPSAIGAGTLFYLAQQARPGWQKPSEFGRGPAQGGPQLSAEIGQLDHPRFAFEKVGDLRTLPATQWLVHGWIPEGSSGIFYGKWAAGKSFIGFDLALHLAYGMADWHGVKLPGVPVYVLIMAREGHTGFVGRIDAFKAHHGLVDDPPHLTFMRASVNFMRDEDFAALCEAVKARDEPYTHVLIDTVARVLPGVDMNEQQTVTLFTERCAVLGAVTGAASIGVHHQNKAGTMMGSVFFEANSDFVFEVTRTSEEDQPLTAGEITCTKMKDGEDRWKRSVRYGKVALSGLDPDRSSLVVEQIGEAGQAEAAPSGPAWPDHDTCDRILAAVRAAWFSGQPWSNAVQARRAGRYAPERISRMFSVSAALAENIVRTWLLNDVLAVETYNSDTKAKGLKVIGVIR